MSTPTQAARKRDFTRSQSVLNSRFRSRNRDRYLGFDGRYEGPENTFKNKRRSGTDVPPPSSAIYTNVSEMALPDHATVWKQIADARRHDALFLWLGCTNYRPRKSLNYASFLREESEEICHLKHRDRTPFDELGQVMDPSLFIEGGFQIKTIRRPERQSPAWMMDNSKLRLLARNLRYDKRGTNMGFSMERAIYVSYLYYRCRLSAGEIAGWIANNYEWFGFNSRPDISQETVENVVKRLKTRGDRFFNKLQTYSDPVTTIVGSPGEGISPQTFDKWLAEYTPESDECQYIQ